MIETFNMYCHICDDVMEWELYDEREIVKVWDCKGCGDTYFESK